MTLSNGVQLHHELSTDGLPALHAGFLYIKDLPKWKHEKPYYISGPLPEDQEHLRGNIDCVPHETTLYDLRGREDEIKMEKHGFELVKKPSAIPLSLDNDSEDRTSEYLEETAAWLEKRLGAEKVLAYAFRYRVTGDAMEWGPTEHDIGTRVKPDKSTSSPHVDQTFEGGLRRARRHMTSEEAEEYLNGNWRIRIVNVWRPLCLVEDSPLAYCDYDTVSEEDLIASDRVSEQYVGEVFYVRYNPKQKWYWFRHQHPDEMAVFLSYDSKPQGPRSSISNMEPIKSQPWKAFLATSTQAANYEPQVMKGAIRLRVEADDKNGLGG
ncbi:hypothetical protein F5B20DRAFT_590399 [Whalleya microplaca]|nr:hypothetical protein F5B20DRAFT_590399 [Whalleya microplaca]